VLAFATKSGRAVLTHNRLHFKNFIVVKMITLASSFARRI